MGVACFFYFDHCFCHKNILTCISLRVTYYNQEKPCKVRGAFLFWYMPRVIDVNTKELIKFSKKLDKISKNALPRVVMNTLNTMAFDTKKRTLIEESQDAFTVRNKTFFKRFSRVKPSPLGKINKMQAIAGMTDQGARGMKEQAGENMRQQQLGGTIAGRSLIPLDTARIGNSKTRQVRRKNRVTNLDVKVDTKWARTTKPKQRFIQSAIYAVQRYGSNAVIKHTREDGKSFMYRIRRGGNDIMTRRFKLGVTPLYSVKRGRSVNISNPNRFTQKAALRSRNRANDIFIKQAKKRIKRGF